MCARKGVLFCLGLESERRKYKDPEIQLSFFNVSPGTTCQGSPEASHEALQTEGHLSFPLIFPERSSTACLLNLLSLSPKKGFFFVNVKFFSLPHKPVLQPFSLEMENVCLKFSQHCDFFAHRNSQLYDMGLGQGYFGKRAFQKNKNKKQKKGKASPFPLLKSLEKTVYFSHDGKESKSEWNLYSFTS